MRLSSAPACFCTQYDSGYQKCLLLYLHISQSAHTNPEVFLFQMADPLTALIHAVQVMNFLKTLIWKTIKERKEATGAVQASQPCSDSPNDQDEPQMSEHLEKPLVLSSQKDLDFPMRAAPVQVFGAEKALHHHSQSRSDEPEKFGVDMDHKKSHSELKLRSVYLKR